jgi:hypothetical protein
MTDQEREIVLKMIEEGKITPEEGLKLMNALHTPAEDEQPAAPAAAEAGSGPGTGEAKPVKSTARRFWQIPLWIGITITVGTALGMYFILRGPGMNFWFFCLTAPLLLGVLIMATAAGSRKARWIFVDVQQKPGERPQRIFLGFPLPLKFTAWFLRTFKNKIPDLKNEIGDKPIEEIIEVMDQSFTSDEPLVVNVDEGEDGEKVQVYIG